MEFFEDSNLELPKDFVNEYEDMSVGEEVDYDYEELSEFYNSLTMAQKMMVQKMAQMMARSTLEENLENLYNGIESTLSSFMQVGINIILCIIFRIFIQSCKFFSVLFKIRILIRYYILASCSTRDLIRFSGNMGVATQQLTSI